MNRKDIFDEVLKVNDLVHINGGRSNGLPKPTWRIIEIHYDHTRNTKRGSWERDQSYALLKLVYAEEGQRIQGMHFDTKRLYLVKKVHLSVLSRLI